MIRLLILAHRYLGIAVGLMMALWCISGIIMMYMPYPEMDRNDELRGLTELNFSRCCTLPDAQDLDGWSLDRARIEMSAGRPVLRTPYGYEADIVLDLASGEFRDGFDGLEAKMIAESFSLANGLDSDILETRNIDIDQWTVYGSYNVHRPLHHFTLDGSDRRELYVSSATGEVVQVTTANQRFWNWIGSVVHWLYPTALRQNTALWANVVIWLSLTGIFLTVIGLYLGLRQFGRGRNGAISPYGGWWKWHHYSGLFFGILILTWVSSGFLSMNPWGALEADSSRDEVYALRGSGVEWSEIRRITDQLSRSQLAGGQVRLDIVPLGGRAYVTSYDRDGVAVRLDPFTLGPAPMGPDEWNKIPDLLSPGTGVIAAGLIEDEDSYFYSHHNDEKSLPAYRLILDNEEQTRYYLNATNGDLLLKIDQGRRWYRWLFSALHRGDLAFLRTRPLWDIVMLLLLLGVTSGCVTGAYMGFRRLLHSNALPVDITGRRAGSPARQR